MKVQRGDVVLAIHPIASGADASREGRETGLLRYPTLGDDLPCAARLVGRRAASDGFDAILVAVTNQADEGVRPINDQREQMRVTFLQGM